MREFNGVVMYSHEPSIVGALYRGEMPAEQRSLFLERSGIKGHFGFSVPKKGWTAIRYIGNDPSQYRAIARLIAHNLREIVGKSAKIIEMTGAHSIRDALELEDRTPSYPKRLSAHVERIMKARGIDERKALAQALTERSIFLSEARAVQVRKYYKNKRRCAVKHVPPPPQPYPQPLVITPLMRLDARRKAVRDNALLGDTDIS